MQDGDQCTLQRWSSCQRKSLEEIKKGNFVVKWNESRFNQVSPDHRLEWLNRIGKRGGGIVGITKTSSTLNGWTG